MGTTLLKRTQRILANSSRTHYLYAITFLLLAIWPLPGTMALRNLLLIAGACLAIYQIIKSPSDERAAAFSAAFPLLCFFVWIVVHFFAVSDRSAAQLDELTGFWLRCLLACSIGIGLGMVANASADGHSNSGKITTILLLGLSGTLAIFYARYIFEIFATGIVFHQDFYLTPYGDKPPLVIFITAFIAGLYAHVLTAKTVIEKKKRLAIAAFALLLALFCFYSANTKNGFLIVLPLTCIFSLAIFFREKRKIFSAAVLMLLAIPIGVFSYQHVKTNSAWKNMAADIELGIAIDKHDYWKNWIDQPAPPLNKLGNQGSGSTTLRVAWVVAALELIKENPLGYGLMNNSFTYLARQKWDDFYRKDDDHIVGTHSTWIDLTLALGIPAVTFLLFSLLRSVWRASRVPLPLNTYVIWIAPTVVLTYLPVQAASDHFFEFLLFLAAFFALITAKRPSARLSDRGTA